MNTHVPSELPSEPLGAGWSCFIVATVLATVMAGLVSWFAVVCHGNALGWALVWLLARVVGLHPMALVLPVLVIAGTLALRALCRAWHRSLKLSLLMLALPPAGAALCAAVAALVDAQARCSLGF